MNFRKIIFWSHLVVGVVAGLVILVVAITGILFAFQKQIIGAAESGVATVPAPAAGVDFMSIEEVGEKVRAAMPNEKLSGVTIRREPTAAVQFNFGKERVVFANPYTGEITGEGTKWRGILHQVEQIHRNLAIGPNGKMITGASSLSFLVLVISGLVLWWPRRWSKANLKAVTVPSLKLRGRARHWNWHNAFGFWAAPFLILVIITGLIMSYQWANNLLFRLTGSEPPVPRAPGEQARGGRRGGSEGRGAGEPRGDRPPPNPLAGVNDAWPAMEEAIPGWKSVSVRISESGGGPLNFNAEEGDGTRPDLRTQLTFNRRTGELEKKEDFASLSLGRQLRMWVKPIHTGEAGGIVGQIVAALVAFVAALLVWTGLGLALRRFRNRRRRGDAVEEAAVQTKVTENVPR